MDRLIECTDRPPSFIFPTAPVSTKPSADAFCFQVRQLYSNDWKGGCRPDCNHEHDQVVENLLAALQATVALPPNPAIAVLAKRTLAEVTRLQGAVELDAICDFVSMRFRLAAGELAGKSRVQRVTFGRQVAMYLCRKLTTKSFPSIGEHFGGRHHATVIHDVNLIAQRIQRDPAFARTIEKLERELAVYTAPVTTAAAA